MDLLSRGLAFKACMASQYNVNLLKHHENLPKCHEKLRVLLQV